MKPAEMVVSTLLAQTQHEAGLNLKRVITRRIAWFLLLMSLLCALQTASAVLTTAHAEMANTDTALAITPGAKIRSLLRAFGVGLPAETGPVVRNAEPGPQTTSSVGESNQTTAQTSAVEALAATMDMQAFSAWVAGDYFERLDPHYRQRLSQRLSEDIIAKLRTALSDADSGDIQLLPESAGQQPGQALVTVLHRSQSGIARLEFHFAWVRNRGWVMFDLGSDGASAGAYYRQTYAGLLKRYGPAVALYRPNDS